MMRFVRRLFVGCLILLLLLCLFSGSVAARTFELANPERKIVIEDHSQALCKWYNAGVRGATLVHIDEHDDFYSSKIRIDSDPAEIRAAFDRQTCDELKALTSSQIQNDALYGIADFIYPAWQLGVVSEVWWVVAEKKPLDSGWLEKFKQRKEKRYPADFLASLQLKNNRIKGVLKGMPVRMLSLQQLPAFDKPILLDIDIDYFLGLYENSLEKQMITLVGEFFRQLFKHKRDAEIVTISVSSNGGYTPVRFRYLGDWMNQAFSDLPLLSRNGPPKVWRLQSAIEEADYLLDRKRAAKLNEELERIVPESGLPAYNRAWIAAQQGDIAMALKWQDATMKRDMRYGLGYQELAGKFQQLGCLDAAQTLLQRGIEVEPQRASFYTQLGSLLIDAGNLADAVVVFDLGIKRLPNIAILHAGRAFALIRQGQISAADKAIEDFKLFAQPGQNTDSVLAVWQQLRRAN